LVSATRFPAFCRDTRTIRVSSSLIVPMATLIPAARIRPKFD
jgi:hypothetical protein